MTALTALPTFTRVSCSWFPEERCITCGPDADRFRDLDEETRRAVTAAYQSTLGKPALPENLGSPIEVLFWEAHQRLQLPELVGLVAQHPIRCGVINYQLDFALVEQRIAFELDGYVWHSTRAAWVKDRRRDINLALKGWRTYRFDGSLVHHDPDQVVHTAARIVRSGP
jgi:very-short-patch-repair endonuclease